MTRPALRTAAFVTAFLAVYAAAVLTPLGQSADAASLGAYTWLPPVIQSTAGPVRIALAVAAGVLALATIVWLGAHRRPVDALRVAVAIGAVTAVSELLKRFVLPRPAFGHFGYAANTLPSGHAAFVAIAFVAALRVLPDAWRPRRFAWVAFVVIAAAALAGPVSYAHRASDVLAALMLVGAVEAALPAASGPSAARWGGHPITQARPITHRPAVAALIAALVGVALAVVAIATGAPAVLGAAVVLLLAAASASVVLASRGRF